MPEHELERAARLATENPYWNPRPLEYEALLALLRRAWRGERPQSS
jgi:maleylacetate reductase